ncbi:hypothetical protein ElyMa_003823900 [Elysia marginata]|uniref:Uncharacterized protein n=1 Tax=Elysia marginata TaxID=1093978 RepID=A0AAV4FFV7_9GAST|nr:hypothetical protein ElyMa_003823900 [Elysia marginata]
MFPSVRRRDSRTRSKRQLRTSTLTRRCERPLLKTDQPSAKQLPRGQRHMNSSVYRQRRPNKQHARLEPTATQLLRLQLRHGPAPTTRETLGLRLASSATSVLTDDSTPQMTTGV